MYERYLKKEMEQKVYNQNGICWEKISSFIKQQICGAFLATEFSNLNLNKNYLCNKIAILV